MTLEINKNFEISPSNFIDNIVEPPQKTPEKTDESEPVRIPTTETPWQQYRKLIDSGQPIPNWPSDDMPSGMSPGRMEGGVPTNKE